MTERIRIDEVILDGAVREDMGDLPRLSASINRVGLLQPIVVTRDKRLIAGRRRLEAIRSFGDQAEIDCRYVDSIDSAAKELIAQRDENECREPLKPSEMLALAKRIEAIEPKRRPGPRAAEDSGQTFGSDSRPRRRRIAEAVGTSHEQLRKIETVITAAEVPDAPQTVRNAAEEMDRSGRVDPAFREVQRLTGSVPPGPSLESFCSRLESWRDDLLRSPAGAAVNAGKLGPAVARLLKIVRTGSAKGPAVTVADCTFPPALDTDECRKALGDWLAHKRVRGGSYKAAVNVDRLLKRWAATGPRVFVEAVELSIANNYQGLVEKRNGREQQRHGAGQRYEAGSGDGNGRSGRL